MLKSIRETLQSWWGILGFCLLIYCTYLHIMYEKKQAYAKLQKKYVDLMHKLDQGVLLQEEYMQKIQSQSDPAWIELVLMKGLGVVPEGQKKFVFPDKNGDLLP